MPGEVQLRSSRLPPKYHISQPPASRLTSVRPRCRLSKSASRVLGAKTLPSGMVDLALIHPLLTVAEDNERGFYLLSQCTPSGDVASAIRPVPNIGGPSKARSRQ